MTINEMETRIAIDALVQTQLSMIGTMEQDGQTRDVRFDTEWGDFRPVAGTALYEPYRQKMGVNGMLSDAERAQMAEAQEQLAEYETQLAAMPADQRAMMERMIGPQLGQIRNMVQGDGFSMEMVTTSIDVSPSLLDPKNNLGTLAGDDQQSLIIKQVQKDLDVLGYEPGPMSGDLTPETVAAIKAFEADNGMPVTGQATMTLANALSVVVLGVGPT